MKCLVFILFLLSALTASAAWTVDFTHEIDGTWDQSSYLSPQNSGASFVYPYDLTAMDLFNLANTNHLYVTGNGGENLEKIYTNKMDGFNLVLGHSWNRPGYYFLQVTDNGGYQTNDTKMWLTNISHFPVLSYNILGGAETNESVTIGGKSDSSGATNVFLGCYPDASIPSISSARKRNDASTNAAGELGVVRVDTYWYLQTNGFFTNALAQFDPTGEHPLAALNLIVADYRLRTLGADTNIGSFTADWNAPTVVGTTTNHCFVTGVLKSGNTLYISNKWDRLGLYYDVPDGVQTNDARNAFLINPNLANNWRWVVQVSNLPAGNYQVAIDGINNCVLTDVQLAAGWNLTTNNTGPLWDQIKSVFKARLNQMGVNYTTRLGHSAGIAGTISGARDMVHLGSDSGVYNSSQLRGAALVSNLATDIAGVLQYDTAIWTAKQQTVHTFSITSLATPTAILTVSSATNAFNVPVILDGSSSARTTNYTWTQTNGTQLDTVGFGRPKLMILSCTNAGTYGFQLVVDDGSNYSTNGALITFIAPTGRTNYVDSTLTANTATYSIASRNGSGSDGNGYTNLQFAANATQAGDLILIRGGTYSNTVLSANQVLCFVTNSGTAIAPIRFEAYPGETPKLVGWGYSDADGNSDGFADGPTSPGFRQTLFLISTNADYIQVKGLLMTNSQQSGLTVQGNFAYVYECVARDNWTAGFTMSRMNAPTRAQQGDVFRWDEAHHNRHFSGIFITMEGTTTFGFMTDCVIADCLSYHNGHDANGVQVLPIGGDPEGGGNSDGMTLMKYFVDNAYFNPQYGVRNWGTNFYVMRNMVWSNCDDGIDVSCGSSLLEDNRSLFNGPTGQMGYKIFHNTQDMVYRGNIAYGNVGRGFELRIDTNAYLLFVNNTTLFNQQQGLWVNGLDATSVFYSTNNVAAFDGFADWPNSQAPNWGEDGVNVLPAYKGDPLLVATNVTMPNTFTAGWTVKQKHDSIETTIAAALSPATNSPLLRAAIFLPGYNTSTADNAAANPAVAGAPGRHWLTNAPDMGAMSLLSTNIMIPPPLTGTGRFWIYR